MANHVLKVNDDFRGELVLQMLGNRTLKAGMTIILSDEDFQHSSIKVCLAKQLLTEEKTDEEAEEIEIEVELDDNDDDELELKPTESKDIDPSDYDTPTTPVVWDGNEKKLLDARTEGAKKALQQLNSSKLDVLQGDDIDFDKVDDKKSEKTAKRRGRPPKNKSAAKGKDKKSTKKGKKKTTKKVAKKSLPMPKVIYDKKEETVSFVDEEQKVERIKKHPILKKKLAGINEEVG